MRPVDHKFDTVNSDGNYAVRNCKSPSFRNQGTSTAIIDGKVKLAPGESVVLDTEADGYIKNRTYYIEFEKGSPDTNNLLVTLTTFTATASELSNGDHC